MRTFVPTISPSTASPAVRLRNQPVQARSNARVESLLDATAAIVDEIGYERLTTAMVAERAGASIGTLYRYYPDRLSVLYALRGRLIERLERRLDDELDMSGVVDIAAWVRAAVAVSVSMYQTERGFRAVHFGDPIEEEVKGYAGHGDGVVATYLVDRYLAAHPGGDRDALIFHAEVAVELADALISRAFSTGITTPDERFVAAAITLATNYLTDHFAG